MGYKTFNLQEMAAGIDVSPKAAEARKMTERWASTGLLEGLGGLGRERMARILENQLVQFAREFKNGTLLTEGTAMSTGGAGMTSSGQVAGFTNVAFPIIRRVFAGLISAELVSVQPMSLPSGLIFYLDYTYGSNVGGDAGTSANQYATTSATTNETYTRGTSVYDNPVGAGIRSGSLGTGGQRGLIGYGYSKVHVQALNISCDAGAVGSWLSGSTWTVGQTVQTTADFVGNNARWVDWDSQVSTDLDNNVFDYVFAFPSASAFTTAINGADLTNIDQVAVTGLGSAGGVTSWGSTYQGGQGVMNLRRANQRGNFDPGTGVFTPDALAGRHVKLVFAVSNTGAAPTVGNSTTQALTASAAISDAFSANADGSTLTIPSFESNFSVDASPRIPEVDFKIEAVNVAATTRKLRSKWSPEVAQDLTAFYSIDIEAELTNLLSEMITLDIDREILNDLLTEASAANYYWSRSPGRFVNKVTGTEGLRTGTLAPGPQFTGNVQEWYQTLLETITDAANTIHRKTLRGSGNFVVTSPDVCTIFEHAQVMKTAFKVDSDGQVKDNMTIGAEAVGTLNNRYTVYKDPYFPVNRILIGLKGSSFLETGYVYAPYVPLILTPVIYGQEDFTPRKGIMTRYGKKMTRSDFYATVTVLDMNVI